MVRGPHLNLVEHLLAIGATFCVVNIRYSLQNWLKGWLLIGIVRLNPVLGCEFRLKRLPDFVYTVARRKVIVVGLLSICTCNLILNTFELSVVWLELVKTCALVNCFRSIALKIVRNDWLIYRVPLVKKYRLRLVFVKKIEVTPIMRCRAQGRLRLNDWVPNGDHASLASWCS